MPDEKDTAAQGSSLNIEALLRMSEQAPMPLASPQKPTRHMPLRGPPRFDASKVRDGVVSYFTKRRDTPALNVAVDILMVVFGLGATAGFLGLVVWLIRIISGNG